MKLLSILLVASMSLSCGYTVLERHDNTDRTAVHHAAPGVPLPVPMPAPGQRGKIETRLLQALDKYESRLSAGSSYTDAMRVFIYDSLVVPASFNKIVVFATSQHPSQQLTNLLQSFSLRPDTSFVRNGKVISLVFAPPRLVWHIVRLEEVDSVYTEITKRVPRLVY